MNSRRFRRSRLQRNGRQPENTAASVAQPAAEELFVDERGLSEQEAAVLREQGKDNAPVEPDSLTTKQIILSNALTYFNLIFAVIAVCLILVGSFRDLTFLPLIIFNTAIGIAQELNAKAQLDRLKFMHAPKSTVVRDGKRRLIRSAELVLGDTILLKAGDQIPADAVITDGELRVDESLLTGEADEIAKTKEDKLLSGSFVVSGTAAARLEHVGADSYVSRLTIEAKELKRGEQSEMIRSLSRLVQIVGIIIIPVAGLLFYQQYHVNQTVLKDSVTATVAAVIGMIPEGLYLLASVAMAVSSTRLAVEKVLVHDMKSIEALARADVLCVDKTGTITENEMQVSSVVPADGSDNEQERQRLSRLLGDFVHAQNADNETMKACKAAFTEHTDAKIDKVYSFSSRYKYSAVIMDGNSYVLGAPQLVLREDFETYRSMVDAYAEQGYRVLLFGMSHQNVDGGALSGPVDMLGLVLLTNPVREAAPETFRYFEKQGVAVKVISGDDPVTVSRVAAEAGIEGAEHYVDASRLSEEELPEAVRNYVVFGRVTPQQKRALVLALQKDGHKVAMTGDGVNDVLALKDADCSIAMASGSDAAAHAAQMVLLESDFSKMPSVVDEGRRVVNNIERTASLFLVKNIFSVCMALLTIALGLNYPLEPSQLSLVSMFTIGVPAFILSLEPNHNKIRGTFLTNVLYRALPAGLADFAAVSAMVWAGLEFGIDDAQLSTGCAMIMMFVGMLFLYHVMQPLTGFHTFLWLAMLGGLWFCMENLSSLFAISRIGRQCFLLTCLCMALAQTTFSWLRRLFAYTRDKVIERRYKRRESAGA